ncbi:MAG: hypothetical protein KGZ65_08210 [Sphingomonadales bacterium]|nr:hypothetical protein [Sphingomonadales bacterium]
MIEDGSDTILDADAIIDVGSGGSLATIQDCTQAVGDGQADDAATSIRQDAIPSPAPVFTVGLRASGPLQVQAMKPQAACCAAHFDRIKSESVLRCHNRSSSRAATWARPR